MKAVIFLGPSLPLAEARKVFPEAVYLPPARQSDIVSAITVHQPDVIGLVDGEFGQSLSVWHKEILFALDQGIHVYGSSSMGALRAAETHTFGTVGVGKVFAMYATGEVNDDDEVALAHGQSDAGYRAFSLPLVNVRWTFRAAIEAGVASPALVDGVLAAAKTLYFPERTWTRIFGAAAAAGLPADALAALRGWSEANYVDQKRQDAVRLLETVRDLPADLAPREKSFEFSRSHLFDTLYTRDRRVKHQEWEVPLAAIGNYAALHHPEYNTVNVQAMNRALVSILADLLEVEPTPEQVADELSRFRLARRLNSDDEVADWVRRNDLADDEFQSILREAARARVLHRWLQIRKFMERTTQLVLDELRLRGEYEEYARGAAAQERIVEEQHALFKETSFHDISTRRLVIEHVQSTRCRMDTYYKKWAEDAGFHTHEDMRIELLRARLAREHRNRMMAEVLGALGGAPAAASPAEAVNGG